MFENKVYSTTLVCADKFGKRQIVAYFFMRDIYIYMGLKNAVLGHRFSCGDIHICY